MKDGKNRSVRERLRKKYNNMYVKIIRQIGNVIKISLNYKKGTCGYNSISWKFKLCNNPFSSVCTSDE